jgi:hypothetical protein
LAAALRPQLFFGAAFGLRSGFVGQAKIKMHYMGEAE